MTAFCESLVMDKIHPSLAYFITYQQVITIRDEVMDENVFFHSPANFAAYIFILLNKKLDFLSLFNQE